MYHLLFKRTPLGTSYQISFPCLVSKLCGCGWPDIWFVFFSGEPGNTYRILTNLEKRKKRGKHFTRNLYMYGMLSMFQHMYNGNCVVSVVMFWIRVRIFIIFSPRHYSLPPPETPVPVRGDNVVVAPHHTMVRMELLSNYLISKAASNLPAGPACPGMQINPTGRATVLVSFKRV